MLRRVHGRVAPAARPRFGRFGEAPTPRRAGQAYLETLLALLVLCVLLFGFLQAALALGGREILHHAASRAARARAVGFNSWMATKAARVAAIPVSGKLLAEDLGWTPADGSPAAFERARIPDYLSAENHERADWVLNYEEWEKGTLSVRESGSLFGNGTLDLTVRHDAPLWMPFARFVVPWAPLDGEGVPRVAMEATATQGEHAGLYLE